MTRTDSIEAMIRKAGWFKGSEKQWQALSHEERKDLAFAGCGCEVAYPTWKGPVDCVHIDCQVRRGEKRPIIATNRVLRYEIERGWLRFAKESTEGRTRIARLVRAVRRKAMETGVYDPWDMEGGWQSMVSIGVMS